MTQLYAVVPVGYDSVTLSHHAFAKQIIKIKKITYLFSELFEGFIFLPVVSPFPLCLALSKGRFLVSVFTKK